MRTVIIIFLTLLLNISFGQSFRDLEKIRLEKKSDYEASDTIALKASNYLLSTPFEKDDLERLRCVAFLNKWMMGNPNFTFSIDKSVRNNLKEVDGLLNLYKAAMVKYSLQNSVLAKDLKAVKLNSFSILLNYCCDAKNNVRMSNHLKKLQKANEKGKLEQVL